MRNTIKRFIKPLKGHPRSLSILLLRGVFFGFFGSILAICIKNMVDYLPLKDWNMFLRYFIIMAVMLAIKDILGYFVRINDFKLQNDIQGKLYIQYLSQYFQGKNTIVDQMGTGKSNSVMIRGIDNRVGILRRIPQNLTSIVIGIITSLTLVASSIGVRGFVAVFILFIGSFGLAQYGNRISAKWRKLRRDLYNDLDKSIIKMIMSKFEILQNNKSYSELIRLSTNFSKIYDFYLKESKGMIISFDLQRTVIDLLRVGLILYIGWGVYQGTHTVGELALVRMLLNTLGGNVEDLNEYITNFHQQRIYVDKLRATFDELPPILGYSSGSEYKSGKGSIQIKNINYSYQDAELIFQNFSSSIFGGTRVALVGPSGGGKSTLMKLIAGYLHPLSGEILVDGQALPTPQNCHSEGSETKGRIHMDPSLHSGGQNIEHISLRSYYPHIGYLTQEPSVFDGTIWENLTYGLQDKTGQDPERSDKNSEISDKSNKIISDFSEPFSDLSGNIEKVITLARCEFIYEFKDGLMTEIGEKGVRLSGGQRQRLAIAKIMLKDPEIILLDEPTSALDSENEELVTQALNELFKDKTVIVIAHRLQTVKHADQILYIDGGQTIESGTHTELIAMKGKYHKMVELQSGF